MHAHLTCMIWKAFRIQECMRAFIKMTATEKRNVVAMMMMIELGIVSWTTGIDCEERKYIVAVDELQLRLIINTNQLKTQQPLS